MDMAKNKNNNLIDIDEKKGNKFVTFLIALLIIALCMGFGKNTRL